jgi:hypothetical protein
MAVHLDTPSRSLGSHPSRVAIVLSWFIYATLVERPANESFRQSGEA